MPIAIRKDTKTLVTILAALLIVPLVLLVALLWPSSSPVEKKVLTTSPTTTLVSGKVAAAETTTTQSSSTTTSVPATAKTKATTTSTTTTAPVAFNATATAAKTNQVILQCISDTYTFSGTISANAAGSVTWTWVRWDGTPTNSSGTSTFTADGETTDVVTPYSFTLGPGPDFTGWVSLELNWNGGNATSPQASFSFTNAALNSGIVPSGC